MANYPTGDSVEFDSWHERNGHFPAAPDRGKGTNHTGDEG